MDGSYHNSQFPTYGYLDNRPVIFTPDGYPIDYAAQVIPQAPYYSVQDIHGHVTQAGMLQNFTSFDVTQNTKHRRSRNGCYTCRARRVKVRTLDFTICRQYLTFSQVRRNATVLRKYASETLAKRLLHVQLN